MKRVLEMLLILCLLIATSLLLPACVAKEGQLPTYEVGDTWVFNYVIYETTLTATEEVIGEEMVEGRDCYVIDISYNPTYSWTLDDVAYTIAGGKYWRDKATVFLGVKHEHSITYNGQVDTRTTTYSYNPWASLFPLEIGKEVETERTATSYYEGEQYGEPEVSTEKYTVVSKEDVTVAAGTFSCWKIIIYDGEGNVTQTMWWSDQVEYIVKMIDADGNMPSMELQSYSVS